MVALSLWTTLSLSLGTTIDELTQVRGALPIARGGVPPGGTTGQVLTKSSNADWVYVWSNPSGGIGGSIADTQVAVGSGTNTIAGNPNFAWESGTTLDIGQGITTLNTDGSASFGNGSFILVLDSGADYPVLSPEASPAAPVEGELYQDSTNHHLWHYTGTVWETYLTGNQTITLSGDVTGSGTTAITTTQTKHATFWVDGAGIVLGTGTKNPIKIDGGGSLTSWRAECKPSCSVTIDLLQSHDNGGLPVTSMVGSGTKPAISSATEASGTISDWTGSTTLSDKDNLAISISGITAATYVNIVFHFK